MPGLLYGMILEVFQIEGIALNERESLMILVRISILRVPRCLICRAGRLSGPTALDELSLVIAMETSDGENLI